MFFFSCFVVARIRENKTNTVRYLEHLFKNGLQEKWPSIKNIPKCDNKQVFRDTFCVRFILC